MFRRFSRYLSLPIVLLLLFSSRVVFRGRRVRIVVMDPRYFGHQCLEPEVFWDDVKSSEESGSRDIWLCCLGKRSTASNRHLWEVTKRRFPTVPSWIASALHFWRRRLRFTQIELLEASIYRLNFLTRRPTTLPASVVMSERRSEILSRLDNPERPYVVFTIREGDSSEDLRNRKVQEMIPAMIELTRRGFNVVRLTSRSKDLISDQSRNLLDWQVQQNGVSGDELVLISGASFVVSTLTGGDCLALAYRKPVLYLDSLRFYLMFLGTELATFQVARFMDGASGATLTLADLLSRNLGWFGDQRELTGAGVNVVKSTPAEIREYVVEYLQMLRAGLSPEQEFGQDRWRELLLSKHGKEIEAKNGEVRATLLPSSLKGFVPTT